MTSSIVVTADSGEKLGTAQLLAAELGLPFVAEPGADCRYALTLTRDRLELRTLGKGAPGPVYVDFVGGANAHRRKFGGGKGQLLPRAVGIKPGFLPHVVDATAGLGRDAFVLAHLGCRVTLIERSPIAYALLRDGLGRAKADAETAPIIERMRLTFGNAINILSHISGEKPDVVVVDPMFPDRGKSALSKKEMQAFQALIGDDLDAPRLLCAALGAAAKRVAVKRPRHGAPIDGTKPSTQLLGESTRFDLYLPQS